MIVCVCHRVSDRDIVRAVESGCGSFDELQAETRVSTRCGACRQCAQAVFHKAAGHGALQATREALDVVAVPA